MATTDRGRSARDELVTIGVRLPSALYADVGGVAVRHDRSKNWVIVRLLTWMLDSEQVDQIEEALTHYRV